MTPTDKYFLIAAKIWEAYFNRRKGGKGLSRAEREKLLEELRVKLFPKESRLDDKALMEKIKKMREQRLREDINNAFKSGGK